MYLKQRLGERWRNMANSIDNRNSQNRTVLSLNNDFLNSPIIDQDHKIEVRNSLFKPRSRFKKIQVTVSPLSNSLEFKQMKNSTNWRVNYLNPVQAETDRLRRKLKSSGVAMRNQLKLSNSTVHKDIKPKVSIKPSKRNSIGFSQVVSSHINNKEADQLDHLLDLEKMGQEEYNRMLKIFKDIDFAHGKAIHMLFGYKLLNIKQEEGISAVC